MTEILTLFLQWPKFSLTPMIRFYRSIKLIRTIGVKDLSGINSPFLHRRQQLTSSILDRTATTTTTTTTRTYPLPAHSSLYPSTQKKSTKWCVSHPSPLPSVDREQEER
jgi:hypothetical protein